jgi:hypothetical protein
MGKYEPSYEKTTDHWKDGLDDNQAARVGFGVRLIPCLLPRDLPTDDVSDHRAGKSDL